MKQEIQQKKEKGITLIALVITIIVLLILAGVTVATLTGDNGLLTKTGAGGILGGHGNAQTWSTVEIYNCYNAGNIKATSNTSNIGGIAYMTRTIINCFSEGNASKIAYSQANGKIENNYLEKEGKIYKDGSEYQGDENLIINNLNQYIYEIREVKYTIQVIGKNGVQIKML